MELAILFMLVVILMGQNLLDGIMLLHMVVLITMDVK